MPLVSKDNTYTTTAFEEQWWKDFRLGFEPPEEPEALRREKELHRHYMKHLPQISAEWAEYEKEDKESEEIKNVSPKPAHVEKGDREERRRSGFGSIISSAMRPSLKKLVRQGIPPDRRAKVWFEKSGAQRKKQNNPGLYAKYVAAISMDSTTIEEIQLDIARTFSMHLMFATAHTKTIMLRILASFTVRNPNYGYCQNMTFIVALILFFLPEEDAFWLFVTIIEDILPVDFCSPTLIGLRVDQKILDVLLKERLPKVHSHFAKYNVDLSCFSTSWLLKLFVNVFPMQTTLRVWDCFLIEGSKILFRVALAFLKLHEDRVRQCTDSGELMTFLTVECKQYYEADRLIKACASFWALRRKQINDLRMAFIQQEMAENPQLATHLTTENTSRDSSSDDEKEEKESHPRDLHSSGEMETPKSSGKQEKQEKQKGSFALDAGVMASM